MNKKGCLRLDHVYSGVQKVNSKSNRLLPQQLKCLTNSEKSSRSPSGQIVGKRWIFLRLRIIRISTWRATGISKKWTGPRRKERRVSRMCGVATIVVRFPKLRKTRNISQSRTPWWVTRGSSNPSISITRWMNPYNSITNCGAKRISLRHLLLKR